MSTPPPDTAAKMAELKNAPVYVKPVGAFGALLGFIVLLNFCASAFSGHLGWGKAIGFGFIQFLLLWSLSFGVWDRHRWAWWALLVIVLLRTWGGLGQTMRIIRVTLEGSLAGHGREIVFDTVGVAQLITCGIVLWFLFSREVRDYVHKKIALT